MSRRRIAIVDLLFRWPPDGGARTDVKEVASGLSQHHEVRLFVPHWTRYFKRGAIEGEFPFTIELLPFTFFSFNMVNLGAVLRRSIGKFNPDHVILADGWYLKPRIFASLREFRPWVRFYAYEGFCLRAHGTFRIKGRPCFRNFVHSTLSDRLICRWCAVHYSLQSMSLHFLHEFLTSGAWLPDYHRAVVRMLKQTRGCIVYNRVIARMIEPFTPRWTIIPSGIDWQRFQVRGDSHPEYPKTGEEYSERQSAPVIGMVARISDPNKGFRTLIQACDAMAAAGIQFVLKVTADAEEVPLSRPYLQVVSWLDQKELTFFYQQLDICVLPSTWEEPFGIVALEAMASGKPVIVTRVGGLQHIVIDEHSGLIVEPGNWRQLRDAILRLLDDEQLRNKLGKNARRQCRESYDWSVIIHRYEQLFD